MGDDLLLSLLCLRQTPLLRSPQELIALTMSSPWSVACVDFGSMGFGTQVLGRGDTLQGAPCIRFEPGGKPLLIEHIYRVSSEFF